MDQRPNQELRDNWPVLAGATVAMFSGATGLPLATSGMFVTSLQSAFGWERVAISFGPALFMAGVAVTTPVVGLLTERFDARKLIACGMAAMVLCFAVLSRMHGDIRIFYLTYAVMAACGNLSGAAAITAIVTRTFSLARGRALGVSMAGAGITTSVAGPLTYLVVQALGWRTGYLAVGLFVLLMAPVVWILLRPREDGAAADTAAATEGVSVRRAMGRPLYWCMALAFFLISTASTGLIVHFVPLLADKNVGPGMAATLASGIGLSTIGARLLSGFLADRYDIRRVFAATMVLSAVGFFLFLNGGIRFAFFGAIAVGMSFGSETPFVGYIIARYYGMKNYGVLFGVIYGVVLSGAVFSPILYGFSRDVAGSYNPMLITAIGFLLTAAVILSLLPVPRRIDQLQT